MLAIVSVHGLADLIRAIGDFAWPAVAGIALFLFRAQISGLAQRVTRARVFGQEFELSLEKLATRAHDVSELPSGPVENAPETDTTAAEVQSILREAATSPRVAVMTIAAELEADVRRLSAITGWGRDARTVRQQLSSVPIADDLRSAVDDFWTVRNQVVHGSSASDDDVLRAVDYGLRILEALDRVPVETNLVEAVVPVYEDPQAASRRMDVMGLVLKTIPPDGGDSHFRIFPTTRTDYEKGKQVSWEWGPRQWGESWYRDPGTGEVKYAWTSSLEFVGRQLDELT